MARRNLLTILLLSVFAIGAFCATTNNIARRNVPAEELSRFQSLLDSIDPGHLHDILHSHLKEKYKHGVFQEDKKALEAVHQEDTEVATSLVELAKRQNNSTSTTAQPPPRTTTETPRTTLPTSTVITTSTAPAPTVTSTSTSNPVPTPSPSTSTAAPPPSTSTPQGPSTTTTTTPVAPTTTSARPDTTLTTTQSSSQQDSSSNNQSPTTTGGNSNPTGTPNAVEPSVTQQVIYRTTLPNGAVTTVTAITVVPAAGDVTGGGAATRTSAGNAGLQTGAATRERSGMNAALLGALGMAAAVAL